MAWCGTGLADLVEVRHELEHRLAFAAEVHERLGGAERGLRLAEETEDELLGLGGVGLAVGLLLRPAGAGDEEQLGVGADGLLVGGRGAEAGDLGADGRESHEHALDGGRAGGAGVGGRATGFQQHNPRAGGAGEGAFHALAVVPAADRWLALGRRDGGGMGVDPAAEALRDAGQRAVGAGAGGGEDDRGGGRLGDGLGCGGIGRVAGLRELGAGDPEEACGAAGGDGVGRGLDVGTDQAHDDPGVGDGGRELLGGGEGFERGRGERAVGFGEGEEEDGFHEWKK